MSDTSGEDWLRMRLADIGKTWKDDVARYVARIAELERAAETSRANYTLAFEGERNELLELVLEVPSHGIVSGDWFAERSAIVARIEKATKGGS